MSNVTKFSIVNHIFFQVCLAPLAFANGSFKVEPIDQFSTSFCYLNDPANLIEADNDNKNQIGVVLIEDSERNMMLEHDMEDNEKVDLITSPHHQAHNHNQLQLVTISNSYQNLTTVNVLNFEAICY